MKTKTEQLKNTPTMYTVQLPDKF